MNDRHAGIEDSQFSATLSLVKDEIANALDQAAWYLDQYAETGNAEPLKQFLVEVQQVRGTFKMLGFRAGERVCEEFAESGRHAGQSSLSDGTLSAFTQAIVHLKRFIELMGDGLLLPPGLLVPVINQIRKERGDSLLPEAYFFLVNLRPGVAAPKQNNGPLSLPFAKARQLFQVGLATLIKNPAKRTEAVATMLKILRRFEYMARGKQSWLYWYSVCGGLEALAQKEFELTEQRIGLLSLLDKQVRQLCASEGASLAEKQPDWLLKEFIYLVSLAKPSSKWILSVQKIFQVTDAVKETELADFRSRLSGPDRAALESLTIALKEELQAIKDTIDLAGQFEVSREDFQKLLDGLHRIGDTLLVTNQRAGGDTALALHKALSSAGPASLSKLPPKVVDSIVALEQSLYAITHQGLETETQVDPVILNEGRILALEESLAALGLVKRAVGSYLESGGDVLHVKNVSKSLLDVSGALFFLEKEDARSILLSLNQFVIEQVLPSEVAIPEHRMEGFADAITAIEYFISSLKGQAGNADEAIHLARESLSHLTA